MTASVLSLLAGTSNVMTTFEILSTLKAIRSSFERFYDKQIITLVVNSYEIYQTKLAKCSFDISHMK